jgi:hypothetical protein
LLHVEASLTRVFQSDLKTAGGATTGGTRDTIAEVTLEASGRRRVDAMGCVEPCYPTFTLFNVLGPRGIVVI